MHFSWLGATAIKIQTKPFAEDIVLLVDPYRPKTGDFPRSLTPHIALFTRGEAGAITLSGNPFILATPGEIETKGVLVTAVTGNSADTVMFRIDAEDLSVGHLGLAAAPLTNEQLEVLSNVDVLLVPVGGKGMYDAEEAMKAVNAIEPRVVIPMAFQSDNDPDYDKAEKFLKEMGAANGAAEKKVIIKKKDLPQEETRVIVLAKE